MKQRTLRASCLALSLMALAGCPSADRSPTPPSPTPAPTPASPAAPQVELTPAPRVPQPRPEASQPAQRAAAAWAEAVAAAGEWPRLLPGLLKDKAQSEALFTPLRAPSPALARATALARSMPVAEPGSGAVFPLAHPLRQLVDKSPLDRQAYPADAPHTVGALALMNPGFLYTQRCVRTAQGWSTLKEALAAGEVEPALAEGLLAACLAAREGRWEAAAPGFVDALSALARQASARAGGESQRAWAEVERRLGGDDLAALDDALASWSATFTPRKPAPAKR